MQARHNAILSLPAYRGTRIADHRQGVCPGVEAPSQTTGDHRRQRQAQVELEHAPTAQRGRRGRCWRHEGDVGERRVGDRKCG